MGEPLEQVGLLRLEGDVTRIEPKSTEWARVEGVPRPLGVSYVRGEDAYNFALYSKHATKVELLLFAEHDPETPLAIRDLAYRQHKTARVWHCRLPGEDVRQARYYAYHVDGPRDPENGQRFDPDKLLLDPYARAVFFPPRYSRQAASLPGSTLGRAPLGVLLREVAPFDWTGDRCPRHAHDAVIYELHIRGFSKAESSQVSASRRGTFAGLMEKIPYLRELGVTAVELMPVFQFDPQEGSHWGYMTLGFFAPHAAYASVADPEGVADEFRTLIKALHQADIEVILDVVYNHTSEGGVDGPTYSFRGLDNTTYYLLEADRARYRDDTGTGNVMHTANRTVRALVLDSLRYWVNEFRVDGFRFDLASIFTRNGDGSINLDDPPIISAIRADPALRDVRLIAEPWDPATYQLGRSFPGLTCLQWNGRFRDGVRRFVKSDEGMVPEIMRRLYGSDDLFPDDILNACRPYQSVNFVTCHDGFTLYDLVAYNVKHNEANAEGDRDGSNDNFSWNCGYEGDEAVSDEVITLRTRQAKNMFALLMMANGTPMFRAGDEFLHTQRGNNNPYNQDNPISWIDWSRLGVHEDFFRFVKLLIARRKAHRTWARSHFWRDDVRWYGVGANPDLSDGSHTIAFLLKGGDLGDPDFYVMVNAYWEPLRFELQVPGPFLRVLDTQLASPADIAQPGAEAEIVTPYYTVGPRSVAVLSRR